MDKSTNHTYLPLMVPRILAMLAAFMIAVVSTVNSAHAVQTGASHDHTGHVVKMMPGAEGDADSCAGEVPCGSKTVDLCDVLCAGLPPILAGSDTAAGADSLHERHDVPPASTLAGVLPAVTEHPPRLRLH